MSQADIPVVGVDFDNTLVSYDAALLSAAVALGLIRPGVWTTKQEVRSAVRGLPGGEIAWQQLQGMVYGPGIMEATLCEGVGEFFKECRRQNIKTYIVSHKTEYANHDETRTNLRQSALAWMAENKFFDSGELGLSREDVFFLDTRQAKLRQIEKLGCTHFIDDLEEVFFEESFPSEVQKILFAPNSTASTVSRLPEVTVARSWEQVSSYILGSRVLDTPNAG